MKIWGCEDMKMCRWEDLGNQPGVDFGKVFIISLIGDVTMPAYKALTFNL